MQGSFFVQGANGERVEVFEGAIMAIDTAFAPHLVGWDL